MVNLIGKITVQSLTTEIERGVEQFDIWTHFQISPPSPHHSNPIPHSQNPKITETKSHTMSFRNASAILTRANRIKSKLQSSLEATVLDVDDVSYQHAGHAAMKDTSDKETHFNLKIVSPKFEGQSLVKRHRMVYELLSDELQSGLHALSIVAKTPNEVTASAKWYGAFWQPFYCCWIIMLSHCSICFPTFLMIIRVNWHCLAY